MFLLSGDLEATRRAAMDCLTAQSKAADQEAVGYGFGFDCSMGEFCKKTSAYCGHQDNIFL
jgi:hypothetical protein